MFKLATKLFVFALTMPLVEPLLAMANDGGLYIPTEFSIYESPDLKAPPIEKFEAGIVNVLEEGGEGWALIDTYRGAHWAYYGNEIYLSKQAALFKEKDLDTPVSYISPQIVSVFERDGDWLKVGTWVGESWVNLSLPSYYIAENKSRYAAYAQKTGKAEGEVMGLVNAGVDLPQYSQIRIIADPDDMLALCNKNNILPAGYAPDDLREVEGTGIMMRDEAAAALERMCEDMRAEGMPLMLVSGYRSYEYQNGLWNSRSGRGSVDRYTARAGHSEHQTGLAADILQRVASPLSSAAFQSTKQYAWLLQHAHEYGFILRYPKEHESVTGYAYEPWHWRYVGEWAAAEYKGKGYETFDQFAGERNVIHGDE